MNNQSRNRWLWLVWTLVCVFWSSSAGATQLIDLTHPFDEKTIYWPTASGFEIEKRGWKMTEQGYFYAANIIKMPEHGGTHIDAPIHFAQHGWTVDQIPLTHLIGPACTLHLRDKIKNQADYQISVANLLDWEKINGPVNQCQFVLFDTGWARFWPDKKKYLGTDKFGDTQHLSFPGISAESAKYLIKAGVKAVGLDTASLDYGASQDFLTHRLLLEKNIYGLENLMNLDKLPALGVELIVAPMKITQGTGGPTRVLARNLPLSPALSLASFTSVSERRAAGSGLKGRVGLLGETKL